MATKRRVPTKLSRARAYWRLAAKAERAGNSAQAERYRSTGDRLHRDYQRDREAMDRLKARRGER